MRRVVFAAFSAVILAWGVSEAGVTEGRAVFTARKCSACHQTAGPAREKTIRDQLVKKGPELWYAGDKFNRAFLEGWLKDPRPIRPLKYNSLTEKNTGDHPRLDAKEAVSAADYLMSLKSGAVKGAVSPADTPKGRIVFIKRYACYGCHEVAVRGESAGGLSGPSFRGAGKRLNASWVYAFLADPKTFKPVKDMPVYAGIMTDEEMRDVAAYVGALD